MAHPIKPMPSATDVITIAEFAADHPVRHFFGTRDQPRNLSAPFDSSSPSPHARPGELGAPIVVVSVNQVHGTDALLVDRPIEAGTTFDGGWDAVITNQPGVLVTVRTADCVPILLHDPIHRVVAAVHSGWRGSVAGIVSKTLQRMQHEFGSDANAVQMAIGPSAGSCCYEVDAAVLRPLQSYPFWQSVVRETAAGRALFNLRDFVYRQARAAGVSERNMWTVDLCTICQPALFHSYRREGVVKATMTSGIMFASRRGKPSG
jgi:polyphenol oxidase